MSLLLLLVILWSFTNHKTLESLSFHHLFAAFIIRKIETFKTKNKHVCVVPLVLLISLQSMRLVYFKKKSLQNSVIIYSKGIMAGMMEEDKS